MNNPKKKQKKKTLIVIDAGYGNMHNKANGPVCSPFSLDMSKKLNYWTREPVSSGSSFLS